MKLTTRLPLLVLSLLSLSAAAQRKQSVLWAVSGHGLRHPSYLFGTVHTLPPSVLDKFPLKQYLRQAQFGVFEQRGKPLAPAAPEKTAVLIRPQPPVDSLFNKRDYAVVDSFFSASPFGSLQGHDQDIDLQSMLYAVRRLKQHPAASPPISPDVSIAEEMERLGKPVFSLDAEDDPDINKIRTSYTQLASAIVSLIRERDSGSYFVPGDTEGTYVAHLTIDLHLNEEATGFGREITVRRNLLWVPQLEQKMQEGPCFVAVGLGHLKFKGGLIKLLRQKGYKLKPIALANNN